MVSTRSSSETPRNPVEESGASVFGRCGNCDAELSGPFCSQCGEKKLSPDDYSLAHLAEEVLDGFTHFDSRFLRTVKVMFTRPGELSNAYFHGGRSRYTKPLSLFIILNVIFFFIQPHTALFPYKYAQYSAIPHYAADVRSHLRESGEAEATYAARFNENLQHQKKSILIGAIPFLALVMSLLFIGSGRSFAEHLVFSVQVYAFFLAYVVVVVLLIMFPIVLGLTWLFPGVAWLRSLGGEFAIDCVISVGLAVYLYAGLRRAYETSKLRSVVTAVVLAVTVIVTIVAYHSVLFYMTFWST